MGLIAKAEQSISEAKKKEVLKNHVSLNVAANDPNVRVKVKKHVEDNILKRIDISILLED